jgi:hypothetical protein
MQQKQVERPWQWCAPVVLMRACLLCDLILQKVICELQAEVERLQELGTSAQQETRLKAELQEAYALGAALQSKLDAQQCISTAPSQDGSGKGQDADGTSSSSASSSPLSSTSLGTLSTEDEPWQEDNLFNMDQCDWTDDSSSAAEACVSGPNANRSARKGSLEEFMVSKPCCSLCCCRLILQCLCVLQLCWPKQVACQ